MGSKKCDTCINKGSKWCAGCEHQCPGLNQFDFYQPLLGHKYEHTNNVRPIDANALMIKVANLCPKMSTPDATGAGDDFVQAAQEMLISVMEEIRNAPTVEVQAGPEKVTMVPGKKQVLINLARRRESEDATWVDTLNLTVDEVKFSTVGAVNWRNQDFVRKTLRQIVEEWMQTQKGWIVNCRASHDFNWGDLVMELPITAAGMTLSIAGDMNIAIDARVDVGVNQDELLTPWTDITVDVYKSGCKDKLGTALVDFGNGIMTDLNSDKVLPRYDDIIWVHTKYDKFPAIWDQKINRWRLLEQEIEG